MWGEGGNWRREIDGDRVERRALYEWCGQRRGVHWPKAEERSRVAALGILVVCCLRLGMIGREGEAVFVGMHGIVAL